jgi:large subunit ribosomal protein L4
MARSVDVRGTDGQVRGTAALDAAYFDTQPNVPVLHQVVTAQLAAARAGTQSTKTRAEVSGGGRKPFKQKGTGRARQGSERAPHFTGGGVALGPKPRSYRQRTPRKMIQLALRSALSDRASESKVVVVESWAWDTPSTKAARSALSALGLEGRVLVVLDRAEEDAYKSFRNLTEVQLILVGELNAYDILCNDWIVFTPDTLPGESTWEAREPAEAAAVSDEPGEPAVPGPLDEAAEPAAVVTEEQTEPAVDAGDASEADEDDEGDEGDAGEAEEAGLAAEPVAQAEAADDQETDR